jgi:hypothetical protein
MKNEAYIKLKYENTLKYEKLTWSKEKLNKITREIVELKLQKKNLKYSQNNQAEENKG